MKYIDEKVDVKGKYFKYVPMFDYRNISMHEKDGYVRRVYIGKLSKQRYEVYVPTDVKANIYAKCSLCGRKHKLTQVVVYPIGYADGMIDGKYMVNTKDIHKRKPISLWLCSSCIAKLEKGQWLVHAKTHQIFSM